MNSVNKQKRTEQDCPNTMKLEFTEGCPLMCKFCGIHGIHTKPGMYKHMTIITASKLAKQIRDSGWKTIPKLEIAMRGEPTMNPEYIKLVATFRKYLPTTTIMLTTNGVGLLLGNGALKNTTALMNAGLNILAVDYYNHVSYAGRVLEEIKDKYLIQHYPQDKSASPYRRCKPNEQAIVVISDISTEGGKNGRTRRMTNQCGCAFPLDFSFIQRRCTRPFREMTVWYDGRVPMCCQDWRGVYRIGNINDIPLKELWQNERFEAARKVLYHRGRLFKPCYGCDVMMFRVGLLPDKTGQQEMPKPKTKDYELIDKILAEGPFMEPVLREWEKKPVGIRGMLGQ